MKVNVHLYMKSIRVRQIQQPLTLKNQKETLASKISSIQKSKSESGIMIKYVFFIP